MRSTQHDYSGFAAQIQHYLRTNESDVLHVIGRLKDALTNRTRFLDGPAPIVTELRQAEQPQATVQTRVRALWHSLEFIEVKDRSYHNVSNDLIWEYLLEQAHYRYPRRITADALAAYDGSIIVRPTSPPPMHSYRPYRDGLLRRMGRRVLSWLPGPRNYDPFD